MGLQKFFISSDFLLSVCSSLWATESNLQPESRKSRAEYCQNLTNVQQPLLRLQHGAALPWCARWASLHLLSLKPAALFERHKQAFTSSPEKF